MLGLTLMLLVGMVYVTGRCSASVRVSELRERVPTRIGIAKAEMGEAGTSVPSLPKRISVPNQYVKPKLLVPLRPTIKIALRQWIIGCQQKLCWNRISWVNSPFSSLMS